MADANHETPAARRLRRLRELGRGNQMTQVNAAVRQVWEQQGGPRPDRIWLRSSFLVDLEDVGRAGPMSRLILSRGVALRLYLLAVFDAHCRPLSTKPWKNTRPISRLGGWEDLIAIDAAYSRPAKGYQLRTKQNRTLSSSRIRQVKSALQKLEELDDQNLVEVPRKANGKDRRYSDFLLMKESGRGEVPTPDYYTLPGPADRRTIDIPIQFYRNGWIQLLYPSEIATWLILRCLRSMFPGRHNQSGVYLYGQDREDLFGLLRDSYEDGCNNLLEFGLIRPAQPMTPAAQAKPEPVNWPLLFKIADEYDENDHFRPQANRYQLTDEGLNNDAYAVTLTSLQKRQ